MFKAVYWQTGATVATVLILGLLVGSEGAISAGIGGFACILPNAWFAWRLAATAKHAKPTSMAAGFFIGEFIKVVATIGLLAIAMKLYPSMHWLSLLIGMVVALHASLFAFWKKS
ncbi:MAG: ATP synthase subunit I [Actinomycetota bacterium]